VPYYGNYNIFKLNRTLLSLLLLGSPLQEHELRAVFDGLTRLLNNVWEAQNTYLPGSVMEIECHQEV